MRKIIILVFFFLIYFEVYAENNKESTSKESFTFDFQNNKHCDRFMNIYKKTSMKKLSLHHIKNSFLYESLKNLEQLEVLEIWNPINEYFSLDTLFEYFKNCRNLKSLILRDVDMKNFPSTISYFLNLEYLEISLISDFKFNESIRKLKKLYSIEIFGYLRKKVIKDKYINYIDSSTKLPSNIHYIESLKKVRIASLCGFKLNVEETFDELSKLSNLEDLIITKCCLDYIPKSVKRMKKLKLLGLNFNNIKELPKELLELNNLTSINLIINPIEFIDECLLDRENKLTIALGNNDINHIEAYKNLKKKWTDRTKPNIIIYFFE